MKRYTIERKAGAKWVSVSNYMTNYDTMKAIIGRMSKGNKATVYRLLQDGTVLSEWQSGVVIGTGEAA